MSLKSHSLNQVPVQLSSVPPSGGYLVPLSPSLLGRYLCLSVPLAQEGVCTPTGICLSLSQRDICACLMSHVSPTHPLRVIFVHVCQENSVSVSMCLRRRVVCSLVSLSPSLSRGYLYTDWCPSVPLSRGISVHGLESLRPPLSVRYLIIDWCFHQFPSLKG